MAAALFIIGAVLVTAGVAAVFWPAALIVAGLFVLGAATLADLVSGVRDRVESELP